jgi:hypothetical protein
MIVNGFAVLDAFLSLVRLGMSLLVVGLGAAALYSGSRGDGAADAREVRENRTYRLLTLAGTLLLLNIISWPVLYLVLQSYVPEWPDVMCIYGVTRIGTGSVGPSRFLPPLLDTLQAAKPLLIFLSGAWFALYAVNRRTATASLTGRVVALVMLSGVLAVGDAACEVAYLAIPKKEDVGPTGCCTEAFDAAEADVRFLPEGLRSERAARWLTCLSYATNAVMAAGCWLLSRRRSQPASLLALTTLLAGALVCLAAGAVFLVEVAAPRLLHLPYHHCPYDLIPRAPESIVAAALFVLACFSVGWAWIVRLAGNEAEARPYQVETVRRLLALACTGFVGSTLMFTVELALA